MFVAFLYSLSIVGKCLLLQIFTFNNRMHLFLHANSKDSDQIVPYGAVRSGYTLLALQTLHANSKDSDQTALYGAV